MNFPESPRVQYDKNPLKSVICQLRFPPILKIETDSLSLFQERIRANYPMYALGPQVNMPAGLPEDVANFIRQDIASMKRSTSHHFSSRDGVWRLTLTKDFIALTCQNKYVKWEEFKNQFSGPFQALIDEFAPSFFTRAGLRYQNLIDKSALGLADAKWADLLKPWIAGVLKAPDAESSVEQCRSQLLIELNDGLGKVTINHGLDIDAETRASSYVIDADFFYDQQMEVRNALERLDHFNKQARRLFRWSIDNRLHDAMGPQPIAES